MSSLSPRLEKIVSYVLPDTPLFDVGADHGLVVLALAERGFKGYLGASEKGKGPYDRLCKAIKSSPFQNRIDVKQGDGLIVLPNQVKQVILAGMGGQLICDILTKEPSRLDGLERLILEPQQEMEKVRSLLNKLGYSAEKEEYVAEKGHIYPLIAYARKRESEDSLEIKYGRLPLKEADPLLIKGLRKRKAVLAELKKSSSLPPQRLKEIELEEKDLDSALKRMNA